MSKKLKRYTVTGWVRTLEPVDGFRGQYVKYHEYAVGTREAEEQIEKCLREKHGESVTIDIHALPYTGFPGEFISQGTK